MTFAAKALCIPRVRNREPAARWIALAAAGLLLSGTACAAEATYPIKPVRLIVPFAPGGGLDVVIRPVAVELSQRLGQQFVVDNRGGAGGILGTEMAARAVPDGYTLLGGSVGLAALPALYHKLSFDPVKDFAPISIAISGAYALLVHPSVPVSSVKELIALAQKTPGKLHYASAGKGSTIHLAGEMFRTMAKVDIVHVPYKGAGPAMLDLVGGHVQLMFGALVATLPMTKAGKLRALAVSTSKRSALMPDTPTIIEAGLPDYQVSGWYGLLAPKGTPKPIVTRLHSEVSEILRSPGMKERLDAQGLEAISLSPDESARFLKTDTERWTRVIREAGIPKE